MILGATAPTAYWYKYTPAQILSVVGKYGPAGSLLTEKYTGVILPDNAAKIAIGKWIFSLQKGAFQNTPDGRRAASGIIRRDMAAGGAGNYTQADIFNALQVANAYLLRDLKAPAEKRGPESLPKKLLRREIEGLTELTARAAEAGAAVKEGLNPKNILPGSGLKWLGLGALGALVGVVVWKIAKP
jgi:hypothetical protein